MQLFLLVTLQKDPLHLPAVLASEVRSRFPDVKFFHIDNYASSELSATAIKALENAEHVAVVVRVLDETVSGKALFPVMKKVAETDRPTIWLEEGKGPFQVFRNMAGSDVYEVKQVAEIWTLLEDFYH